jgi:hypothetical protein
MIAAATDHARLRAIDEVQQQHAARCEALYAEWQDLEAALAAC